MLGISMVVHAWRWLTPLPKWTKEIEKDASLGGLSPIYARITTLHCQPRRELRVNEVANETVLAEMAVEDAFTWTGVAYDLTFDSETRFWIKADGLGDHVEIPYDRITSPSGKPVSLSQPKTTLPYTPDANCEWVLDAQSKKIYWIPPEVMRKGGGGYFWVGASLVMLGDDGVVRELSFEYPDC
jgi:hypothetical protein